MRIAHVAQTDMDKTSGMSRIAWHWREAFEERGHEFLHCGVAEVGELPHRRFFPKAALRYYNEHMRGSDMVLVHEPVAGVFAKNGIRTTVFSHGLERRGWEMHTRARTADLPRIGLKSRLIFPLWRLHGCDVGMRRATGALVSNQDDKAFAISHYDQKESNILVFKNGVNWVEGSPLQEGEGSRSILFMGMWAPRKGIHTLARAAHMLQGRGVRLKWTLAGTGCSVEETLRGWPASLHGSTEVIPQFDEEEEAGLIQRHNLFALPSFFEGQPLALLQAMAHGRCCITTGVCGQKDIIRHRSNGLLFEPGMAATLADLIEEASGDLALQKTLGANARFSVKDAEWRVAAAEVADFVEQISARGQLLRAA